MTDTNTENKPLTNTQKFQKELEILCGAAVGIIAVSTREPHRAARIIRELAFFEGENGVPCYEWNNRDQWFLHQDDPNQKPDQLAGGKTALAAVQKIAMGDSPWMEGYFIVHNPHWYLKEGVQGRAELIQCIKQYAIEFAETDQRLFLIVPDGWAPPLELQHDITPCELPSPSFDEIKECYDKAVESAFGEDEEVVQPYNPNQVETLVNNAAGMTEREAEEAFARAIIANDDTFPDTPFDDFNKVLLACKTDVVKRSKFLTLEESVSFDDVGGLDLFKEYIWARRSAFTKEARDAGVDAPKGNLTVGPPGTGKSLCAKATASALGIPLILVDIGKLMGGLVGDSERNTRSMLKQLDAMAPCVALVDEVDKALGGAHQGGGDSGVTKRVLGAILTHMQESKAPIYWSFTANRANVLPPELIRKGRVDELFCITMGNIVERSQVLQIHLAKRGYDPAGIDDLLVAAKASKGFVASEIEGAVKEAILVAYNDGLEVTGELIAAQFKNFTPLTESFKEDMEEMMQWAKQNAQMTSSECEDEEEGVAALSTPGRRRIKRKKPAAKKTRRKAPPKKKARRSK